MVMQDSVKSVREQIEDSARGLWLSVMARDLSSNDKEECQHMSLHSVIQVMFGPCTTGRDPSKGEPAAQTVDAEMMTPNSHQENHKTSPADESSPKKTDMGVDAAIRALFAVKSNLRAEEAVSHLREQMEHNKLEKVSARQNNGSGLPAMFPASSPNRRRRKELPQTIHQSQNGSSMDDTSHDDGISVITMNTLDEVAKPYEAEDITRVFSDVTQEPIEEIEESWKQTIAPHNATSRSPSRQRTTSAHPFRFGRSNRSQGTAHTKRSSGTKSFGTKSTNSTETTDFMGVWLKEEQEYWADVVKEQNGIEAGPLEPSANHRRGHNELSKSKDIFRKTRHARSDRSKDEQYSKRGNSTITTAHSTVFSGPSLNSDRSLFASQRNPDGFLDLLIMPHGTEFCEI